jgi:ATP-binding cassette subfamily C protein CydC
MIRPFLRMVRGFVLLMCGSVLLASLTILSSVGLLGTSAYLITYAGFHPSIAVLQVAIVGVRFFGITRGVFRYLERLLTHSVNLRILARLRKEVFQNLVEKFPLGQNEKGSAQLLTSIVQDIEAIENLYVRILSPIFTALLVTILVALLLGIFSVEIMIVFLFGMAINGLAIPWLSARISFIQKTDSSKYRSAYQQKILHSLQSFEESVVMGINDQVRLDLKFSEEEWAKSTLRSGVWQSVFSALGNYTTQGFFLVTIITSAWLIENNKLESVFLGVVSLIVLAAFESVNQLPASLYLSKEVRSCVQRIDELVDLSETRLVANRDVPQNVFPIQISELHFRYKNSTVDQLHIDSLEIRSGEKIAIVGVSGSGKTTLLELLTGFQREYQGELKFSGVDQRNIDLIWLRDQIGYMDAFPYIFHATIRENFALAKQMNDDDLTTALTQTNLEKRIAHDLDQNVFEHAENFSGGEIQRLALARILVRGPKLIILDEPFRNIDPINSRQLTEVVWDQFVDSGILWVTHDYQYMEKFDRILVIQNGKIVEMGTHQELFEQKKVYYRIYIAQYP